MDTFGTTPMVGLIRQVPTPATTHKPPTCDPRVSKYCALTGPEMKASTRLILRTIGDFVDPATGTANPSFDTIAFWSGSSKGTVSNAVKEARALGIFETSKIPTAMGNTQFKYHFVHMMNSDFQPLPRRSRATDEDGKPMSLELDRLTELMELRARVERLENVDRDRGEILERVHILNEKKEEREFSSKNENDELVTSFIPSVSVQPLSVQPADAEPLNADTDFSNPPDAFKLEYVKAALSEYLEWGAAWNGKVQAYGFYRTNWAKFLEDLDGHRTAHFESSNPKCGWCQKIVVFGNLIPAVNCETDRATDVCADCADAWPFAIELTEAQGNAAALMGNTPPAWL